MGWVVSKQVNECTNTDLIITRNFDKTTASIPSIENTYNDNTVASIELNQDDPEINMNESLKNLPPQILHESNESLDDKLESLTSVLSEKCDSIEITKAVPKALHANKLNYIEINNPSKKTKMRPLPKVQPPLNKNQSHNFPFKEPSKRVDKIVCKHNIKRVPVNENTIKCPIRPKPFITLNKKNMVKNLPPIEQNTKTKKSDFKIAINSKPNILKIDSPVDINEKVCTPLFVKETEKIISTTLVESNYSANSNIIKQKTRIFKSNTQRPHTTQTIDNKRTNIKSYDFIVQDFNNKLNDLIRETHNQNEFCNCPIPNDKLISNTSGKITFFFIKRYGNFGKFLLARLNEFLDSAHNDNLSTNNLYTPKCTNNNFPLPCNAHDIEYSELKPKPNMSELKFKTKSKLPKLIKNTKNFELIPKQIINKCENINFTDSLNLQKCSNIKLPPLKLSDSTDVLFKTSMKKEDKENKTDEVYKTVDLTKELDEDTNDEVDSKMLDKLEEDAALSEMANRLIDDLWFTNNLKLHYKCSDKKDESLL